MARKRLTDREEADIIAAAEAARDSGVVPEPSNVRVADNATVVMSVRLPIAEARLLRAVAEEQGMSLSEALGAAVRSFVGASGPRVSVGSVSTMVFYRGVGPVRSDTPAAQSDRTSVQGADFSPETTTGAAARSN